MTLKEALQNMKAIMPDPLFAADTRSRLLYGAKHRFTLKDLIRENIELGAAIALTGLLVVVGLGAWNLKAPNGLQSLDVKGLKAEADAISDVRVEMEQIEYTESTSTKGAVKKSVVKKAGIAAPSTTTSTNEESLSPTDALDALTR
jgi:hypothetical protein